MAGWDGVWRALAPTSPLFGAIAYQLDAVVERLREYATPIPIWPVPAARRAEYQAAFERFCQVFPDALYVSERGRMHLDRPRERQDKGRFLSAGFHNMFGISATTCRSTRCSSTTPGRRELDALWRELDFITNAPRRQHADFIFYERAEPPRTIKGPEFDFIRSEDKASASPALLGRLRKAYLAQARDSLQKEGGDAIAIPVLERFFDTVATNIRRVERDRLLAERASSTRWWPSPSAPTAPARQERARPGAGLLPDGAAQGQPRSRGGHPRHRRQRAGVAALPLPRRSRRRRRGGAAAAGRRSASASRISLVEPA
jgi:hypothetical protein